MNASPATIYILAGGLGTRLAHITKDVPKPMAIVAGRPFLEWQIEAFRRQGFHRFVLLVGYKHEVIRSHFGDGSSFQVEIRYSVEQELLGTGGAFLQALRLYPCERFVLVNGDSYFDVPLRTMLRALREDRPRLALALKPMEVTSRYGVVQVENGSVVHFLEKDPAGPPGLINGGVYCGHSTLFDGEAVRRISLETDLFPQLLSAQAIDGLPFGDPFIDIGVPEDFERAQTLLPEWHARKRSGALFLDRDGILVEDTGYVGNPKDLRFLSLAEDIMKKAVDRGMPIVVVSNQAGVAKGLFTEEDVEAVNAAIQSHFSARGLPITRFYYCPHHPEATMSPYRLDCYDRKPNPGMILRAVEDLGIVLESSLMVGDKDSDVIVAGDLETVLIQGRYEVSQRSRVVAASDLAGLLPRISRE